MSAIVVQGKRWAVGLDWVDRTGRLPVAQTARRLDYRWIVPRETQTGFALDHPDHTEGLPSLAACLAELIPVETWMALIEGQGGRFALIKVTQGGVLADGDTWHDRPEPAIDAWNRAAQQGFALYATPGVGVDATDLDLEELAADMRYGLAPAPLHALTVRRIAAAAAVLSMAGAATFAALHADEIWELLFPAPKRVVEEAPPEPMVRATIDSVALLEGCRRALRDRPLLLPGWTVASLQCQAALTEPALTAVAGDLFQRPALVVQWRLEGGRRGSVYREIALAHLRHWSLGQVDAGTAWGVASLPGVMAEVAGDPPPALAWRRALDRRVGPRARRFEYVSGANVQAVRIETDQSLGAVARWLGSVPALEVTLLRRRGSGWQLEARRTAPVELRESVFEARRKKP